jgi:hypothetical protein
MGARSRSQPSEEERRGASGAPSSPASQFSGLSISWCQQCSPQTSHVGGLVRPTRAMLEAGTAPRPSPPAKKVRWTAAGAGAVGALLDAAPGTSERSIDTSEADVGAGAATLRWTSCAC